MEKYTYNFEISTLIAQFLDIFDGITIKRYRRNNGFNSPVQTGPDIKPTFLYSPKQRTIHDYINNQAKHRLPIVSISMGNIRRDESRVFNKIDGPSFGAEEDINQIAQPVPVDLTINMAIMSKHQEDIDQIVTNFIPYSDPYVIASWNSPYLDQEIRTVIEWSQDVTMEYPTDTTFSDHFRIIGNTNFTIKGWLFKAELEDTGKPIHNIYMYFNAVSALYCSYEENESLVDENFTDVSIISGRPQLKNVNPYKILNNSDEFITVVGNMFEDTQEYYLSGDMFQDTFYSFTTSKYISAFFDYNATEEEVGFYGYKIEPTILSDNIFQFHTPSVSSVGYFDIIAFNDAGIGKLTEDSYNSLLSSYQFPCISGAKFINNDI